MRSHSPDYTKFQKHYTEVISFKAIVNTVRHIIWQIAFFRLIYQIDLYWKNSKTVRVKDSYNSKRDATLTCKPSYVQLENFMEHFCSSNGKYSTLIPTLCTRHHFNFFFNDSRRGCWSRDSPQDDLKMAEESHVRLPSWVTITFVDNKAELYSESALYKTETGGRKGIGEEEKHSAL